jgi:hypothetical protein
MIMQVYFFAKYWLAFIERLQKCVLLGALEFVDEEKV